MTAVVYTAERELTAGHTQGVSYALDMPLVDLDRGRDVEKTTTPSMSGANVETVLLRSKQTYRATTKLVAGGERDAMREFLESTIGGETFTFDRFGSALTPDNPINVIQTGEYSEQRGLRRGDGGRDDMFRFSFTFQVL